MYKFIKRFFDIILSIILLPFFLLIYIFIFVMIKLDDRGPVLYKAPRIGKNSRIFNMLKFRSMKVDSPNIINSDGSTFNSKNDPRVTRIGRILRETSIDEIPQILNVLKGDMSFIGPRASLESALPTYTEEEKDKMKVRPGITGYTQAYFRNSITTREKRLKDAWYANNVNIWLDLKIIFKTIFTIILRKNIYTGNINVKKEKKMFSEWIREIAFWIIDFLKGSPIRKHYKDIKKQLDNNYGNNKKRLKDILDYSVYNTEFYSQFKVYKTLEDFPVINKNIIKENFDKFKSGKLPLKKCYKLSTSGSTGTPFIIYQNKDKRSRVYAEMLYLWGLAGYRVGMRYIFFRIWNEHNKKSKLIAFSRNLVMKDILCLDEKNLEGIRLYLKKDKKVKMLLGYASTLENLANYLLKCGDTPEMFSIKTIISGSEILQESTRDKLNRIFNCLVYSLYSNQENGMLAIECKEHKEFHLNTASYNFEILKIDSDAPAEIGEMGRIVVTDFYNKAFPLIRYDTGDLAIKKEKAECGFETEVISNIEGRRVDLIYKTDGTPLSPHTWGVYMWKYDKLKQ